MGQGTSLGCILFYKSLCNRLHDFLEPLCTLGGAKKSKEIAFLASGSAAPKFFWPAGAVSRSPCSNSREPSPAGGAGAIIGGRAHGEADASVAARPLDDRHARLEGACLLSSFDDVLGNAVLDASARILHLHLDVHCLGLG